MRRSTRGTLGITLVELMIVVVIIAILAAISVVGYRKYIGSARISEATSMLAEFAAKEQLYFLDNGQYMELHKDPSSNYPSTTEAQGDFWPHDPSVTWDSAREVFPPAGTPTVYPTSWVKLGARPRWGQFYCTYLVNAGPPNGAIPSGGRGATFFPSVPPQVHWFYAVAACNFQGDAGWPTGVTVLGLTHESPRVLRFDE